MDVSIIVINYNTFDLTCQCIRSIIKMTQGISYEIILVDNASTERKADDFKTLFPQVNLIKSVRNLGFSGGNNLGILVARGKHILLLNSDTELKNNAVAIAHFQLGTAGDGVAVLAGRLEFPDGMVQHNAQRFPSVWYKGLELLRIQKIMSPRQRGRLLLGAFFNHNDVMYADWVWGTFFMFKKALLTELPQHKLADDFFMYGEDMMWCMEFRRRGYQILFSPEPVVVHYMGKSGGDKSDMMMRNEALFMKRYYTRVERWCIRMLDKLLIK